MGITISMIRPSTPMKLATYGLALAAIATGAWAIGSAVGPLEVTAAPTAMDMEHGASHDEDTSPVLPGLSVAEHGYRLDLRGDRLTAGAPAPFQFRILGPEGAAVTRFEVVHDKQLHLVMVRRDGSNFQHVHPNLAPDGTWSIPLTLRAAGSYRVFTDFTPQGGEKTVLGADIQVAGEYRPDSHQSPQRTFEVDGYQVRLTGDLTPGKASNVTATVTKRGAPVADLQPYLGAYGHLVALRAADLGYLHVHPLGEPGDGATPAGPEIRFAVEVPTAGTYRLFLDFQHEGTVRTAEFTVDTGAES
jgi:hypothetical protein